MKRFKQINITPTPIAALYSPSVQAMDIPGTVIVKQKYLANKKIIKPAVNVSANNPKQVKNKLVSIVIPVLNELENVKVLNRLLNITFNSTGIKYEVIYIDDHSTDGTYEYLKRYSAISQNVRGRNNTYVYRKAGKRGKSFSLHEGFGYARGDVLVMVDADLQYPVGDIPQMVELLKTSDIIVANRKKQKTNILRRIASRGFRYVFGRMLFGLNTDVQSGLKVFKRRVLDTIKFVPETPWTFDLEFLYKAHSAGFKISNHDIVFAPRLSGVSKMHYFRQIAEIGWNAVKVRTKRIMPFHIPPLSSNSMRGAGIGYKGKQFITHTTLPYWNTAFYTFVPAQIMVFSGLIALFAIGLIINYLIVLQLFVTIISMVYFVDVVFNFFLIWRSLSTPREIQISKPELINLDEKTLPLYSILCPLYKEAAILPQFLKAINKLEWPKNKLEVLLLLEEDDKETIKAASQMKLPAFVRIVIVPFSQPKTKPKACNYGLSIAKGDYIVIYDAEDVPEPLQLKKAYIGFKKSSPETICLQAKLNYYNPKQNLLTRFFTAEYSLWFDLTLPGMQSFNTGLPLGGTSNHFKTGLLKELKGWDTFNVTEDADLGIRLFKQGYITSIIDSLTLEEANSNFRNWLRQRSRWIKGYIQSYLVHSRTLLANVFNPGQETKTLTGYLKAANVLFSLNLTIGSKLIFIFLNPLLWIMTLSYFMFYGFAGPLIESVYVKPAFYLGVTSLVFGNFLFFYYYMIGLAKRNHWDLITSSLFIPLYWVMISISGMIALYQLLVKPHYWEKTIHGLHLEKSKVKKDVVIEIEYKAPAAGTRRHRLPAFNLSKLWAMAFSGSSILILSALLSNFINYAYNIYLGRYVTIEEFGLISLINNFTLIASIPTSAVSAVLTYRTAYYLGKYKAPIKLFWQKVRTNTIIAGFVISTVWVLLIPRLADFFHVESWLPFLLFAPVWFVGLASAVDTGFLSGGLKFRTVGVLLAVSAVAKLLLTIAIVEAGYLDYIYSVIPLSYIVLFFPGWFLAKSVKEPVKALPKYLSLKFPLKFFVSTIFTKLSEIAFLTFDVVLAKHYLSPREAGEYAMISLVGKTIFFVGNLFSRFVLPLVSHDLGAKKDSRGTFKKLFLASSVSSYSVYMILGLFGSITAPLIFGNKITNVTYLLPYYGLAMFCYQLADTIIQYNQTHNKHIFASISLVLSILQVSTLILFHENLNQMVMVMTFVGVFNFILILFLHIIGNKPFKYLSGIFKVLSRTVSAPSAVSVNMQQGGYKVLIFNWRDSKHTWAGGAEAYIEGLAQELIKQGNQVTIFCGNDGKNKTVEYVNGIQIIRKGGFYTVYFWAMIYYLFMFRGNYDVVIDSENGLPFFTPLYVRKPKFLLIHHIHQKVFRTYLRFPLSVLAMFLEAKMMPLIYRKQKIITVSESSRKEIIKLGLSTYENISVINPGINLEKFLISPKTAQPSLLYLGRLKPYKNLDVILRAFKEVLKLIPHATLTLAGTGESKYGLMALARQLGVDKSVEFLGHVSEQRKQRLLATSWVMLQPSMVEGWGITVIEANASGTPVIASRVNGLIDSVQHKKTGILVAPGDVNKWAIEMTEMLLNNDARAEYSREAYLWAQNFSWALSMIRLDRLIKDEINKPDAGAVVTPLILEGGEAI